MSQAKTERLLNLVIALLDTSIGLWRGEIRHKVAGYEGTSEENFERTFERDKKELRALGVPVKSFSCENMFADDTKGRKYRIDPKEYGLEAINFTVEELAIIHASLKLFSGDKTQRLQRKFSLPSMLDSEIFDYSLEENAYNISEISFTSVLVSLTLRQACKFTYTKSASEVSYRLLHPYGVGIKYGHWYLAGEDQRDKKVKVFRISKMSSVSVVEKETFKVPESFSLAKVLKRLVSSPASYQAALFIKPDRAHELKLTSKKDPRTGHYIFPYVEETQAVRFLAKFGDAVHIVYPKSLKTLLRLYRENLLNNMYDFPSQKKAYQILEKYKSKIEKPCSSDHLLRLLELVPYLLENPGAEVEQTAKVFRISTQKLIQDLELLFVSGLPGYGPEHLIEASWEQGKIYLSNASMLARPLKLTNKELSILLIALKLLAQLPGVENKIITTIMEKLKEAASFGNFCEPHDIEVHAEVIHAKEENYIDILRSAITECNVLAITYFSIKHDRISVRRIEPQQLVLRDGYWYLEAWCKSSENTRFFKLQRIQKLEFMTEKFIPRPLSSKKEFFSDAHEKIQAVFLSEDHTLRSAVHFTKEVVHEKFTIVEFATSKNDWLAALVCESAGKIHIYSPAIINSMARDMTKKALLQEP